LEKVQHEYELSAALGASSRRKGKEKIEEDEEEEAVGKDRQIPCVITHFLRQRLEPN